MEPTAFPGRATIDQWVTDAEARLQQLTAELNAPLPSLRLDFHPPGYSPARSDAPQRPKQEVQREIEQVKTATFERIEQATTSVPVAERQHIRDDSFGRLFADDIQRLEAAERGLAHPADSWSAVNRQTGMRNKIREHRARQAVATPSEPRYMDSLSDRFQKKAVSPQRSEPPEPTRD